MLHLVAGWWVSVGGYRFPGHGEWVILIWVHKLPPFAVCLAQCLVYGHMSG